MTRTIQWGNKKTWRIEYKLGEMAWYLGKYKEGIEYYNFAIKIAHNKGNLENERKILFQLVRNKLHSIGEFDEAIQYGMRCLEISKKLGRVSEIVAIFNALGFVFLHQGNYIKAIEMHKEAVELSKKYGRERSIVSYLASYQSACRTAGKFEEAIESL